MIFNEKLVAIIRNVDPEYILDIADVLKNAGIKAIEVSLSETERGLACIDRLIYRYGGNELAIGAGTVSKKSEIDQLVDMGVTFILTPGYDDEIVSYASEKGLGVIPGVLTPSEIQQAVNKGIMFLKLFPADAFAMQYIKSLKGPFPQTEYLAVGGVNQGNAAEFFKAGFAGIAVGSNLVPQNATTKDLKLIEEAARAYVAAVMEADDNVFNKKHDTVTGG